MKCIGKRELDLAHRRQKEIDAVFSASSNAAISSILNSILAETTQHFRDEDQILESIDFPDAAPLAVEHRNLLETCHELIKGVEANSVAHGDIVHFIVHDLIKEHMLVADRKFFLYTK